MIPYGKQITTRDDTISKINVSASVHSDGVVFFDMFRFKKENSGPELVAHISVLASEFPAFAEFIAEINRESQSRGGH